MTAIDNFCRVVKSPSLATLFFLLLALAPAPMRAQNWPVSRLSSLRQDWAIADFDGDRLPDVAITEIKSRGFYRISLQLSGGGEGSHFDVESPEHLGLTVRAQDVDGDHDLDLVITSGISRRAVGVWLNDGAGNFTEGDPSLYPERMWRGPPELSTRDNPSDFLNGLTEHFRYAVCFAMTAAEPIRPVRCLQIEPASERGDCLLSGQWHVRPPPAV